MCFILNFFFLVHHALTNGDENGGHTQLTCAHYSTKLLLIVLYKFHRTDKQTRRNYAEIVTLKRCKTQCGEYSYYFHVKLRHTVEVKWGSSKSWICTMGSFHKQPLKLMASWWYGLRSVHCIRRSYIVTVQTTWYRWSVSPVMYSAQHIYRNTRRSRVSPRVTILSRLTFPRLSLYKQEVRGLEERLKFLNSKLKVWIQSKAMVTTPVNETM